MNWTALANENERNAEVSVDTVDLEEETGVVELPLILAHTALNLTGPMQKIAVEIIRRRHQIVVEWVVIVGIFQGAKWTLTSLRTDIKGPTVGRAVFGPLRLQIHDIAPHPDLHVGVIGAIAI